MVVGPESAQVGTMPTCRLLLVVLASSSFCTASSQIRVRLYDYSGVSARTLARAKTVASEVLEAAGVNVTWANCPSPNCAGPAGPAVLQVRIISEEMARLGPKVSRTCMGYAILSGQFSTIAAVFYHRALDLEKGNLAGRSEILGTMLAHEIGHLLLGKASHSTKGIMRGIWGDQDIKAIARGRMWFTEPEARKLVANTTARIVAFAAVQ